jgi:hypothetical protein
LSGDVDALKHQHTQSWAAHDSEIESLGQRLRSVERAAADAEETARSVARQLVELNRITVEQAVILVSVRDDLLKRLPVPDSRRRPIRAAKPNGGTE